MFIEVCLCVRESVYMCVCFIHMHVYGQVLHFVEKEISDLRLPLSDFR